MKKLLVVCLALGITAGTLIAAPQPGKSDDKSSAAVTKACPATDLKKMEEALAAAEKKGDAKAAACIKKCIEAQKALDAAVKSGDKAAIAKAQESCKKIMEESKGSCPCPADAKKDAAPAKAPAKAPEAKK